MTHMASLADFGVRLHSTACAGKNPDLQITSHGWESQQMLSTFGHL